MKRMNKMAGIEIINIDKSYTVDNDTDPAITVTVGSVSGQASKISGRASFVKSGTTYYSSTSTTTETSSGIYTVVIPFSTANKNRILNSKTTFTLTIQHTNYGSETATFDYTNDTEPPVFKLITPNKTNNRYVTFNSAAIVDITNSTQALLLFYISGHVYDKVSGIKSLYVNAYYNGTQIFNTTLGKRQTIKDGISDGNEYWCVYSSPSFGLDAAVFGNVTQGIITFKIYITDNANNTTDPDTDSECTFDVPFVINTFYKYVRPAEIYINNSNKMFELTYENTADFKAYPIIMGYWKNNSNNSTTITAEFYDSSDNLLDTVTNTISGVKGTYQPFITKLTNSVTDTGTIKVKVALGTTGDLFKHVRYCVTDLSVNNTSMIDTYTKLVNKYCMPYIYDTDNTAISGDNVRYYGTYWLPTLNDYSVKDVYVRDSDGLWKSKKDMYYFKTKDTPKKIKKIFVKENGEWRTYLDEEYSNNIQTSYVYYYAPESPVTNTYTGLTNTNGVINITLNVKSSRTATIDSVTYYFINTGYELCENYRHLYDVKDYTIGDYLCLINEFGSVGIVEL